MGSVGFMRRLDQAPLDCVATATQPYLASSKRNHPCEDEERERHPPRISRHRPSSLCSLLAAAEPQPEDDEDETDEASGDSDEDSEYGEEDEDEEEDGDEAAAPAPAAKQPRRAGVSSRSVGATGGWGGGGTDTYECILCGKIFGKACKLARHAATHTGDKPFVCDEVGCTKAFSTKDKLKRHVLSHARRKAGLSTSVGNAARREAETRQRAAQFVAEAAAAGISLEAPRVAGKETRRYLPLMKTATAPLLEALRMERERAVNDGRGSTCGGGDGGWKYSCPSCGRNFLDNYHLKRHIKAIHEGPRPYVCDHPVAAAAPAAAISADDPVSGVTNVAAGADPLASELGCGLQGKEGVAGAGRESAEAKAGQDVGREGQPTLGPTVRGGGRQGEQQLQQRRVYGVCGAAFAKKWQLREHFFAEHGQTKFNCRQHMCPHPGCGRAFDRPSKLAAHQKTHEARFVCQFEGCGAAFVLASGLNLHLKEEHPFRCGVCDKIFDREDKMLIHQGTHGRAGDGDFIRPFHCNVRGCGKAFTEKRNLNAHRRTQHTEGGRKRFRCEASGCTMAFAHRHTLVKHVKREHQSSSSSGSSSNKSGRNASSKSVSSKSTACVTPRKPNSPPAAAAATLAIVSRDAGARQARERESSPGRRRTELPVETSMGPPRSPLSAVSLTGSSSSPITSAPLAAEPPAATAEPGSTR